MLTLVTGSSGFIGSRVLDALRRAGHETAHTSRATPTPPGAVALDLTDTDSIPRILDSIKPRAVIHLAAVRDLARCEREPALAQLVNVDATRAIARWCSHHSASLVFASTDQVFDGLRGMYREDDEVSPRNVYGRSKAAGEEDALNLAGLGRVARIALTLGHSVEGDRAPNEFIVNLLRTGRPAPLFINEYRTPIHVDDAANALVEMLSRSAPPILHLGGPDRVNRLELGLAIARAHNLPERLCEPSTYQPAPGGLYRSPDTSLDTTLAKQVLRSPPRSLHAAIVDLARTFA
jgi:dTDP-4-dehydrorhamnose reductase